MSVKPQTKELEYREKSGSSNTKNYYFISLNLENNSYLLQWFAICNPLFT